MKVTREQVVRGVQTYYDHEIVKPAHGVVQFSVCFLAPSIPRIVNSYMDKFCASPLAEWLIDKEGHIDLDAVREQASTAMAQCGSVELMGYKFDASDIDLLYRNIMQS